MDANALLVGLTPTPADLAQFKGLESAEDLDAPEASVKMHLTAATAMFVLASEITELPDPMSPVGLMIRYGILDMAWFVGTSMESRDEMFSPFSSERIGSYSYSKSAKAAQAGEETGVPFFDAALKWFLRDRVSDDFSDSFGFSSEHVFKQPYSAPGAPAHDPIFREIVLKAMEPDVIEDGTGGDALDYVSLFEEGR